jgi:hypothetical protein
MVARNCTPDAWGAHTPAQTPTPAVSQKCQDMKPLTTAIYGNAQKVCAIDGQLGESDAIATCERARRSCDGSKSTDAACKPWSWPALCHGRMLR